MQDGDDLPLPLMTKAGMPAAEIQGCHAPSCISAVYNMGLR